MVKEETIGSSCLEMQIEEQTIETWKGKEIAKPGVVRNRFLPGQLHGYTTPISKRE